MQQSLDAFMFGRIMPSTRGTLALLFALLLAGACADAPTIPDRASGAPLPSPRPIRDIVLDPVIVIGEPDDPGCDPALSLNWCENDGGGDCMTSSPSADNLSQAGVMGCLPGGGGGETGDGGASSPGGGSGTSGGDDTGTGPFAEGPMLWAACVIAIVGGTFSVEVVGNKFQAWYDAHKALVRATNSLDYILDRQRDGYYFDPGIVELAYYRLEVATEARDAAVDAVEEATGVSALTLLAAALTCGAAAAAPTP